ncbi:MAG: 2-oxo acid dehydrogenase subunit E2 [Chloroflexales bacterium]|nr:2-oxo acid dehydrogenase subunit E2 [Chloroflexales bacterium]
MPTDVIMPKVDMVMESGAIVRWYRQEYETVCVGEPLLEIETDKATIDVEAPASGILAEVSAHPGDTIPVAATIALIFAPGEEPPIKPILSPVAEGVVAARAPDANNPRPRATPLARNLARQHGLDLWQVAGSGSHGRVMKEDILRTLQNQTADTTPPAPRSPFSPPALPDSGDPNNNEQSCDDGEMIPLRGARRVMAERLALNTAVPTFTLSVDVVMSRIQELRERLPFRPSVTAFIIRAVAPLLLRHPNLNASFRPEGVWRSYAAHLGIAMDVDGRLLVPVIRNAQNCGLCDIQTALYDLHQRAKARQLGPGELQGSSFSISNLGMFGIDSFTALINPPEAAILAVGRSVERPYRDGAAISFCPTLTLTLSVDHRVADGAMAARFLNDLRNALEEPGLLL